MKWKEAKKIINSNPEVLKELENNTLEYEIIREIINVRKNNNLTQQKLAEIIGTKQSNISRLESGEYNPTVNFLEKVAKAVGKKLEIKLV